MIMIKNKCEYKFSRNCYIAPYWIFNDI